MLAGVMMSLALVSSAPGSDDPLHGNRAEFRWEAPAQCPSQEQVRDKIERLLGQRLGEVQDVDASFEAQVEPTPDGWAMGLTVITPNGIRRRRIEHARCDLLGDATALVVAIAIDPMVLGAVQASSDALQLLEGNTESDEPRSTDGQSDTDEAAPKTRPHPRPRSTPTAGRSARRRSEPGRPRGGIRVAGAIGFGTMTGVEPGAALTGALIYPRLRFELNGRYWVPRDIRVDAPPDAGVQVQLWSVGARACPVFTVPWVEFPLCAGLQAGGMLGRGTGVAESRRQQDVWVALAAGPAVAFVPSRWIAIWIAAEGFVALSRPAFSIEALGEVHRAGPAGVRGFFGLEARFP